MGVEHCGEYCAWKIAEPPMVIAQRTATAQLKKAIDYLSKEKFRIMAEKEALDAESKRKQKVIDEKESAIAELEHLIVEIEKGEE